MMQNVMEIAHLDVPVKPRNDFGDDFPLDPDDWGRDKVMCQYFDDPDEPCTQTPEYFIHGYCWDPGCTEVHEWHYCLRHFASNIVYLVRSLQSLAPEEEMIYNVREGAIPIRYQLLDWGRMGTEGSDPLPEP